MGSLKSEERITKTSEGGSTARASPKARRWLKAALGVALLVALCGGGYYYFLHRPTSEGEIVRIESLIAAGNDDEARALMLDAQVRSRDVDGLRLRIGRAFLHEGKVGPATALLSRVEGALIKEERLAIAEYFLVEGDPFSAVRFYEAAMKTGMPRTASLLGRYGEALSLAGNGALAVTIFNESLTMDPSRIRVRVNLAVTLANLDRRDEAKSEALAVLKDEPQDPTALKLLAALGDSR